MLCIRCAFTGHVVAVLGAAEIAQLEALESDFLSALKVGEFGGAEKTGFWPGFVSDF